MQSRFGDQSVQTVFADLVQWCQRDTTVILTLSSESVTQ